MVCRKINVAKKKKKSRERMGELEEKKTKKPSGEKLTPPQKKWLEFKGKPQRRKLCPFEVQW